MNRTLTSGITLFGALALTACGSGPNVDQVRADFDNPSGSVSDSTGVLNAQAQVQGAGPAAELGSDPFAFIGGSGALTAAPTSGFRQVHAARVLSPYFNRQIAQIEAGRHGLRQFSLTDVEADFSGCASELESQLASQVPREGATSAEISIELDLSCVDGFSGTMTIDAKAEVTDTSIDYEMTAGYDQVCYEGTCIDGDFAYEFALSFTDTSGSAKYFGAWNFTVTTDGYSLSSKGGLRLAADSATEQASVEYLFYVNDSNGNEVSYVLEASADAESASLTIRGRDGSITCTTQADGSGQCEGDLTWTAEDLEAAQRGG